MKRVMSENFIDVVDLDSDSDDEFLVINGERDGRPKYIFAFYMVFLRFS